MTDKKNKKAAVILVILLLIMLIISLIWIYFAKNKSSNSKIAKIYRNDELIKSINLSEVTEKYWILVEYDSNGNNESIKIIDNYESNSDNNDSNINDDCASYNIIEVRKDSIAVVAASCPDHLCMNMGFIDSSLLPITCLPNHLVIQIEENADSESDSNSNTVDAIAR